MSASQYDSDFYLWTQEQAALLRQGLLADVDAVNLAEEIESMGKRDRRSLSSHIRTIQLHLLKWQYQHQWWGNSWQRSIWNGRREIEVLLRDSPSLTPQLNNLMMLEYPHARKQAAIETGLPLSTFPEECPFTVEQVTGDFWPE